MSNVRVVLVRPQIAGNIGAVARCMENFAAGALYLVEPKVSPTSREAMQRSTHGEHRLHSARVVGTLAEALEGSVYAIAASRRPGPVHQADDLNPRDMGRVVAEQLAACTAAEAASDSEEQPHTPRDVALLFGSEDNGLSREDLLACDAVVVIPGNPTYPTMNLSHAVAVCLYEVFTAVAVEKHTDATVRKRSQPADLGLMTRLMEKLQRALLTIGYLHPEKPDHLMFPIRAILSRAELSRAEAQILIGLAQQIEEFGKYGSKKINGDEERSGRMKEDQGS